MNQNQDGLSKQIKAPGFPDPDGVLLVNKHAGCTSHDIVNDIRHLYHTKKVGHTGTLDPLAEGVLVVLLGRSAKAAEYLVSDQKEYRARLRLGCRTDTEDISGNLLSLSEDLPTFDEVKQITASFVGKQKQIPPMYSALKVNGQKLCDLARKGITVEREAREITVFSLETESVPGSDREYDLTVRCSSGTYIRTLCADIGNALGCGGVMAALTRTEAGGFRIEDSIRIQDLRELEDSARLSLLHPTESLFSVLPPIPLSPFAFHLIKNGCSVALSKLKLNLAPGTRVRLLGEDGTFFALGEVFETGEGPVLKSIKQFVL